MEFQRARTQEQVDTRRKEILNACEELFQTTDYDEITLKGIAERTSISRTSLYSYYQTKEDVFLGLLEREYLQWHAALGEALAREDAMTVDELCACLTDSMLERTTMRRLLSVNLTDIEKNCSFDRLKDFKKTAVGPVQEDLRSLIQRTFPQASEDAREWFRSIYSILVLNAYPYTHPTPKQMKACREAGLTEPPADERGMFRTTLLALAAAMR